MNRRILNGLPTVLFIAAFFCGCTTTRTEPQKPLGLVINEDTGCSFEMPPEKVSVDGLNEMVDRFAGTQVTHMFINPNGMRVNYRSKVWTAIWEGNNPEKTDNRWVYNTWFFDQKGIDPYAVWIARCREKNISPWISMRMNDVHEVSDMTNFMHSPFWKKHPQFWRVPFYSDGGWVQKALDYAHPEVRQYNLALIREYLERYDMDGLELDWMRFGYHFAPSQEQQGCQILTDFTREVRQLTRDWSVKRGHPIKLAARVPAVPEYAKGLGMDGVAWVQKGLVDMLIPCPFWTTADFDIPIDRWRELIGPAAKNVILAAGMEQRISGGADAVIMNNIETMRGFTAAQMYRGADQIYLFNHMEPGVPGAPGAIVGFYDIMNQAAYLKTVIDKPRRHVVTFHDTIPSDVHYNRPLPQKIAKTQAPAKFRLYTGPKPDAGQVIIRVGLHQADRLADASCSAQVNSVVCAAMPDYPSPVALCRCPRVLQFNVPCPAMKDGYNLIEITSDQGGDQTIDWVEVYIAP